MSGNTLGSAVKWLFLLGCGGCFDAHAGAKFSRMKERFPVGWSKWKECLQCCGRVAELRTHFHVDLRAFLIRLERHATVALARRHCLSGDLARCG
jgi:hypothetical protein